MLRRNLLFWLILFSIVAFQWRVWFQIGIDPFVESKPSLPYLIMVTMFAIGCLLTREEVALVFRKWPTVLGGTVVQYTAMPLFAFLCAKMFALSPNATTGLIVVGCVPGAMASNVLTLAAKGNVSYSVSLTTSATLLSPLIVPLTLSFALQAKHQIDPRQVGLNLLYQVVLPVVCGHLLRRFFRKSEPIVTRFAPLIANATIIWIIAVVVGLNRDYLRPDALGNSIVTIAGALLVLNLLGYSAGYLGGRGMRLPEPMRRALTLEVGMQNAGLGTVLAGQMFPNTPEILIPTAAYTFGCMLTGTVLAQFWSRRDAVESDSPGETPQ